MPKYFENTTIFYFNWDQVAQSFWKRYPNPYSNHVLSEDTVYREVKDGRLHSKRLLTKTNFVPKWGARFVVKPLVKICEESVVDPGAKIMTTYTYNMGYSRVMSIVEKVVYKVYEDNPCYTIAVRSAWIDSHVFGFSRAIRAFGVERFKINCVKAIGGFNHVLNNMFPQRKSNSDVITNTTTTSKITKAIAKADNLYNRTTKTSPTKQPP